MHLASLFHLSVHLLNQGNKRRFIAYSSAGVPVFSPMFASGMFFFFSIHGGVCSYNDCLPHQVGLFIFYLVKRLCQTLLASMPHVYTRACRP